MVVTLDVEHHGVHPAGRQVVEAGRRERAAQAAQAGLRVDPQHVDLADRATVAATVRAGICWVNFRPVEPDDGVLTRSRARSVGGDREEEASGIEPVLRHVGTQARQIEPSLLGVPGEGPRVHRKERRLVLPRYEGPDPHPGRQRRRGYLSGSRPAHLQQHPAADQSQPTRKRLGGGQVAIGPDRPLPVHCRAQQHGAVSAAADRRIHQHLGGIFADGRRDANQPTGVAGNRHQVGRAAAHCVQDVPGQRGNTVNNRGVVHQLPDHGGVGGIAPPRSHADPLRHAGAPADSSRSADRDGGTIL